MRDRIRIRDFKAALLKVVAEVQFRPADKKRAFRINHNPHLIRLDKDVAVGRSIDKIHLVLKARTTAANDGNAQSPLSAALFFQKRSQLRAGGVKDPDEFFIADSDFHRDCRGFHSPTMPRPARLRKTLGRMTSFCTQPVFSMTLFAQSLSENRRTLALASPIVAGFIGQMLMGLADTVMVGRIGVVPLAACAFANTVLAVPLVFGFGVLSSISVRASHAHGKGDKERAGEALRAGLVLAAVLGLLVALAIQFGVPLLPLLGQKPEVNAASVTFLILCGWSVLPVYLTTAAKNFCEALSQPWIPFWIVLASVLLNVALNWLLIYGNLGFPALGLEGAGIATLLARIAATVAIFAYVFTAHSLKSHRPTRWLAPGLGNHFRKLVALGLPVGGLHFCEVSGFAFGSLMMGWISVDALAAHQIAITCAATTFMLPLGISQAVSVRVGQARGARQTERCRPIVFGAIGVTLGFMAGFAVLFIGAGRLIAGMFVPSPEIISLAAHLLIIAGVFQLFDGLQIVSSGALRGFEDTRAPMLIGAVAYWVVALPVSGVLAFGVGIGAPGIWMGFVAGLAVAAVLLFTRLQKRLRSLKIPA